MQLDFAFLADAAQVDASGKLSVLGVFDRIQALEFPTRHPRMALVLRLASGAEDEGDHAVEILLHGPGGEEVLRLDGQVRFGGGLPSGAQSRMAQVLNLDGVVFSRPGLYEFSILLDRKLTARLPLLLEGTERPMGRIETTGPGGVPIVLAPRGPAEA
jgi:hypothetical protein